MAVETTPVRNISDGYVRQNTPSDSYAGSKRIYLKTDGSSDRFGYYYHSLPFPRGAQLLSAKLYLFQDGAIPGETVTITPRLITGQWDRSDLRYATRPPVSATAGTTKSIANPPNLQKWEIDLQTILQTVSNGAEWWGFRLEASGGSIKKWFSSEAVEDYRPYIEISWADPPEQPENLRPGDGGVVSVQYPIVQADFTDIGGDAEMDAMQVVFGTSDVVDGDGKMTAIEIDSGTKATTEPELDTATIGGWGGLAINTPRYWQCRMRDAYGRWSPWSEVELINRISKSVWQIDTPVLTLVDTNLLSNPGAEGSTAGLQRMGGSLGANALSPARFKEGTTSYLSTVTTAGTLGQRFNLATPYATAGQVLRWACWAYFSAPVTAQAYWEGSVTSTAAYSGGSGSGGVAYPAGWNYIEGSYTVAADRTVAGVGVLISGNAPIGFEMNLDHGIAMINATAVTAPFNGSTLDTDSDQYDWSGAANASTSTRRRNYVFDATPLFSWSKTSGTPNQRHFQFLLERDGQLIYVSKKVTTTALNSVMPAMPYGPDTLRPGPLYKLILRIWDDVENRQNIPNDKTYSEITKFFYVGNDSTVGAVSSLVAVDQYPYPWVKLTWTRASGVPDLFEIYRGGELLEVVSAVTVQTSGNNFEYYDRGCVPYETQTYEVRAVVNKRSSVSVASNSVKPRSIAPMLCFEDGTNPVFLIEPDASMETMASEDLVDFVGNAPPILVLQNRKGFTGEVSGLLVDNIISGLDARTQRNNFKKIMRARGRKVRLTVLDEAMKGFIMKPDYFPMKDADGISYQVEFTFVQQDYV